MKFIFATTEHHKIPDTILSRCQEFEFRTVPPARDRGCSSRRSRTPRPSRSPKPPSLRSLERPRGAFATASPRSIRSSPRPAREDRGARRHRAARPHRARRALRQTMRSSIDQDTATILTHRRRTHPGRPGLPLLHDGAHAVSARRSRREGRPGGCGALRDSGRVLRARRARRVSSPRRTSCGALDVLTQTEDALRTSPGAEVPSRDGAPEALSASSARLVRGAPRTLRGASYQGEPPVRPLVRLGAGKAAPERPRRHAARRSPGQSRAESSRGSAEKAAERATSRRPVAHAEEGAPTPDDGPGSASPPGRSTSELDLRRSLVRTSKRRKPMLHALVSHHERAALDGDRLDADLSSTSQRVLAEQLQQQGSERASRGAGLERSRAASSVSCRDLEASTRRCEPDGAVVELARGRETPVNDAGVAATLRERAEHSRPARAPKFIDTFQGEIEERSHEHRSLSAFYRSDRLETDNEDQSDHEASQALQEKLQAPARGPLRRGAAGGGMVKVQMNGNKTVLGVSIDPEVVDKDDVEMLQDLVTAAVNEACRKVDEEAQQQLGSMAGGLSRATRSGAETIVKDYPEPVVAIDRRAQGAPWNRSQVGPAHRVPHPPARASRRRSTSLAPSSTSRRRSSPARCATTSPTRIPADTAPSTNRSRKASVRRRRAPERGGHREDPRVQGTVPRAHGEPLAAVGYRSRAAQGRRASRAARARARSKR